MDKRIARLVEKMEFNTPTTREVIKNIETQLNICFPDQYVDFLLESNGAEGSIGAKSYLAIWPTEQLVQLNEEYAVNEFTPGLVYFGSDGGGMAYAFDKRNNTSTIIVEFPFESIHIEDSKFLGKTFAEFLECLYERK